jgi:N-carbamoylputrescine amidase
MRITVCELAGEPDALDGGWKALVEHAQEARSDVVVLPEMPFAAWLPATRAVDEVAWSEAVAAHDRWLDRLGELGAGLVLGSRPVTDNGSPFHEGFVWDPTDGYRAAHRKTYLPDEPGFWEASWYRRGPTTFEPVPLGEAAAGFLICTELWFSEHARDYGAAGVNLVVCPRATPAETADKWVAAGRVAAVRAGAYCVSSNRAGAVGDVRFAGLGWVIHPEEGDVLATTGPDRPFATVDVNLADAERAKASYPRYIAHG